VSHNDDCQSTLAIEPLEYFHHFHGRPGIQGSCGFVSQNERRIIHQRPRDCDALLLATGQLAGHVPLLLRQSDDGQSFAATLRPLCRADTGIKKRKLDVLQRRCPRHKVETLEYKPDSLVSDIGQLGFSKR
jgi:hypothetical protein